MAEVGGSVTEETVPEPITGLTSAEAARLLSLYGLNEPIPPRRRTALAQVFFLLSEPLTLVLLIAASIAATLGELVDSALIVAIVLMSTVVNFAQVYRSQRAVDQLRMSMVSTARVLRDATWRAIPRTEIVPGDIIRLAAGD